MLHRHLHVEEAREGLQLTEYAGGQVQAEGTVQEMPEVTSWQYGEYLLVNGDGEIQYALRGADVQLSDYVGHRVRVSGSLIDGYPVDGGPEFLEVTEASEV